MADQTNLNQLIRKPGVKSHTPFTPFQEYDMSKLGMWIFIATEILFFGVLFATFTIYRYKLPETWLESHKYLSIPLGAVNTVVLLFSSFTVAWAVHAIKQGKLALVKKLIWATLLCGAIFMGIKTVEYTSKASHTISLSKVALPSAVVKQLEKENKCFSEKCEILPLNLDNFGSTNVAKPVFANIFFTQYFIMTGIHGLHIIIGIGLFIWLLKLAYQKKLSEKWFTPIEIVGLYWHIVDVIWIYIFPLIYLTT